MRKSGSLLYVLPSTPRSFCIRLFQIVNFSEQMTSFNGTPIKKHLATKGIKHKFGAVAAQRSGYLRVVTASKPCAKDTLKLRNGRGMKRDCSYVNFKKSYEVSLSALARYGLGKEEVDKYRLTAHALKVLLGEVVKRGGMGKKL